MNQKLSDIHNLSSSRYGHPSWKNSIVRSDARRRMKSRDQKICTICGYTLHVEACHIQDITSFPLSATLDEVNSETNLVALCRNCHWEFDHGFLEVCGIKKVCKEIEKFTSCIECGSKIQKTSVRCKSCSDKYNGQKRQKISWPDSNRLKNMLEEHNMNWSALARTLGVSCNSIRRRFRDHP